MKNRRLTTTSRLCALIVFLYLLAFFLPFQWGTRTVGGTFFFHIGGHEEPYTTYGWQVFVEEAKLLRFGVPFWLAHPVLWFGIFCLATGRVQVASRLGIAGAGLELVELSMFIGLPQLNNDHLGVGFLCWFASLVLLAAANWIRQAHQKGNDNPTGE